jgi:DNA-directed RNA polymerase II subunit RPB2
MNGMSLRSKSKSMTKKKHKTKKADSYKGYDISPDTQYSKNSQINIDDSFVIADLYFKQKNILYTHLYNSFNKFLDEDVKNLLLRGDNIFFEKITKDKIIKYKFRYTNISIKPPAYDNDSELMFPNDARKRNLTYAVKLVATVTQVQEKINIFTDEIEIKDIGTPEDNIPIATIPVMVRSKYCSLNIKKGYDKNECEYDPGGYFIVNGAEKAVMSLERMCDNKPLIFAKKDSSSVTYLVQVNSKSHKPNGMTQVIAINMKKDKTLTINVPILNEIPVFILIRALGIEADKDVVSYVVNDDKDIDMMNLVRISLENTFDDSGEKITTQDDAIEYLTTKMRILKRYTDTDPEVKQQQKKIHLISLLTNNFLPHVEGGRIYKAYYLCYMIHRLLNCILGRIPVDDRDSYVNKRIDLPGDLINELFKQHYKKMLNECNRIFKKKNNDDENPFNIVNQIKPNIIEQGLKTALLTGAWSGKRKGVAQMLQRITYLNTITSLRRVNSPTIDASTNKLTSPRHLHPTQIPFLCYIETPEGHKVGLVKSLSLLGNVTVMKSSQVYVLKGLLSEQVLDLRDVPPRKLKEYTKVFLNGEWIGVTGYAYDLYKTLKHKKINSEIESTTSIVYDIDSNNLYVYCDGGRLYRPMLRVKNNVMQVTKDHIKMISIGNTNNPTMITKWGELMVKHPGLIEYIDMEEQMQVMAAMSLSDVTKMRIRMKESVNIVKNMKKKDLENIVNRYDDTLFVRYTHCEIHPSLLIGVVVSNIPFCNHNQGPRNIFQFSQAKQAMGIYTSNYRDRLDISYILYQPMKPLVTTRTIKYINTDSLTAGENTIVAIACYTGYNQEDSVILNQSAVDRGLFRSTSLKKYIATIQKNQSTAQNDQFMKPDPQKVKNMKPGSYEKLNEKGYVPEETPITNGDVIICKVSPIPPMGTSNKIYKDNSEIYKAHVDGVIDKVYAGMQNHEGYEMIKIRIRSERIPQIGDKFCLTEEHEVLTDKGWKGISDVTKKDKIATLNKGVLKYENPIDTYEFDYNGDMYKLESEQVDLDVTMDHELYIKQRNSLKYERIPAKDVIGKRVRFKKNCVNNYKDQDMIIIKGEQYKTDDFLDLLGIFMAGGYSKKEIEDKIINCFPNETLYDYIKQFNEGNEHLPKFVFKLSQRQSRILIESLTSCDASSDKHKSEYCSSSKQLVDDIMRLSIHAGWSSYIKTEFSEECLTQNSFIVRIIKSKNEPMINHEHIKNQKETVYKYKGKVYCLEVPSHVFMTRLHGKNVWIGNCSRAGQKGTIGITLPHADMPFTENGITPDIIMNPNAIPSRMTIGQFIECLTGKIAAIRGQEIDGTPFNNIDIHAIKKELESLGYKDDGTEILYNGMTGKKMRVRIFIGPTYYMRLKHMVNDKLHARSRGPRTLLTRQAPEGRSRDGGLRVGEMERDAISAHGMAKFLKERMLETADSYTTHVCGVCGLFAQRLVKKDSTLYPHKNDVYYCPACNNKTNISKIMIPYAFKLLIQELLSMCIAPRIRVKQSKFTEH